MGKIHIFLLVLVSVNAPEHVKDALEVSFFYLRNNPFPQDSTSGVSPHPSPSKGAKLTCTTQRRLPACC